MKWLEAFKPCFGHRAQVLALRRYVQGLLSDSARKSMEAMLARVTDPGSYQAFQHFITDAPWKAEQVWRQLRTLIPERGPVSREMAAGGDALARGPRQWLHRDGSVNYRP